MYLRALGTLRVSTGEVTRPKPLLLLTYLALEGPQPRHRLARLFFPDSADPADALSTSLRRLRRPVALIRETTPRHIACTVRCDVLTVLNALDTHEIDTALDAYVAPFVEDLDLSLPAELEEWVFSTREYLAGRVRAAAIAAAEDALVAGARDVARRYGDVAYSATGAWELEPVDLARLHAVLADTRPVHAEQLRRQAAEIGISLEGATNPRTRVAWPHESHTLPVERVPLVGRDRELGEISEAMSRTFCRIVCLHGPGGIGKTRLALEFARQSTRDRRYRDGVYFVALEDLARTDQVPHAIARALGPPPLTRHDTWLEIASRLDAQHALLLLDGVEHLKERLAPRLRDLLTACPDLSLLVTSRERLALAAEWVLSLDGLPVPSEKDRLDQALATDAVHLFVQRAKGVDLSFTPAETELPQLIELCRRLEGIPLALELAASWTRALPLRELPQAMTHTLAVTDVPLRDVPPRHRSLEAVLDHSWKLLSARERKILRQLAVFQGGFRREAASAVVGATISDLVNLVDKSMLRMRPDGRFVRHALVHEFTRRELSTHPSEEAELHELHGRYFTRLLERASSEAGTAEFQVLFDLLEEEEENVLACLSWAVEARSTDGILALSEPLLWYYPKRGRFHEGAQVFAEAIANLDAEDGLVQEALASLSVGQAFLTRYAGNIERAKTVSEQAETLARGCGSRHQLMRALNVRGQAVMHAGHYHDAASLLEEALALARRRDDVTGLYRVLGYLVHCQTLAGNYATAEVHAREGLGLYASGVINEDLDTIALLLAVGVMESSQRNWEAARSSLERAVMMIEGLEYQGPASVVMAILANALVELARSSQDASLMREASRRTEEGLALARANEEGMGQSLLEGVRSRLALQAERRHDAERLAVEAVRHAWAGRDMAILFWSFPALAEASLALGKVGRVRELCRLMREHHGSPHWVKRAGQHLQTAVASVESNETAAAHDDVSSDIRLDAMVRKILRPWASTATDTSRVPAPDG